MTFKYVGVSKLVMRRFLLILLLLFTSIVLRFDPIEINSDDYHVFNYVRDMVEKPSYFSMTGGGYRVLHRLIYLPVFWLYDFNAANLGFPALVVTWIFDLLLVCMSYVLFKKIFNWRVATIVVFLMSISHLSIKFSWIWGGTHQNIATFFLLLCVYFLIKSGSAKDYFFASLFGFLAIMTRESVSVIVFGIFVASLFLNGRYKSVKNYFIAFWPFVFFGSLILLNVYFLGGILRSDAARLVHFSLGNFVNLYDYFIYFVKTLLIVPIGVCLFLVCLQYKTYFSLVKQLAFDKTVLLVWFVCGVIVLLATVNSSLSYSIPILPILFVFIAKILDDVLFSKSEVSFDLFQKCMLFNLLFWFVVFNASNLNGIFGFDYKVITFLFNAFFYFIFAWSVFASKFGLKNSGLSSVFKLLVSIVFVSFTLTSFFQLGLTYSFFVFQHNYTDAMRDAVVFIAKNAPENSFVVRNPVTPLAGPLTGIDLVWFEAFKRTDLKILDVDRITIPSNLNGSVFYVGTPVSSIDTDIITPLVYANKQKFKPVVRFGSQFQKYPSLRIPNSFSKIWSQFKSSALLFRLEPLQAYQVFVFEEK